MGEDKRQTTGGLFEELVGVMARLRGEGGCPWDREQTHASLKRYAVEETYELLEAIDQDDAAAIRDELGDVLLQVLFHAQMAREDGRFAIEEVMAGLRDKLVRRHPHVFGDEHASDAGAVLRNWERIKAREKPSAAAQGHSLFTSVPRAMPALARAQRIGDKAAGVGFDWPDVEPVWGKVAEELEELKEAAESGKAERVEAELGDLLFAVVNLSRFLKVQAEEALEGTLQRFHKRFAHIERALAERGKTVEEASFEEMDALWEEAKAAGEAGKGT
ncbi:MAG: nucleoside triphosphate pyrophosphohydrolase [Deltaproteobacteria bacterium]|nr:nucleoside triphosphate pyrophosphohydrolase [Deltaproteobacteria bacterium]